MTLARIRKALVAGLGAGIGAAAAVLLKADKLDAATLGQALAALLAAGVPIGWATWRIPNASKYATGGVVRGPIGPIGR